MFRYPTLEGRAMACLVFWCHVVLGAGESRIHCSLDLVWLMVFFVC